MLNMNINWVLDRNFSLLIGSDDRCVSWNKMAILQAVHYFTIITIVTVSSLILYLRFTTANVKLSAGQHYVNCEVVNWVMNTN